MPQASGSRSSLGYIEEVAYGVTPANPAFKAFRRNSDSLAHSKAAFQSNELRSDRQIADFRHGIRSSAGSVVSELSYGSFDDMLEAALCGTWAADVLKAGIVRRSFTLEKRYNDVAQFMRYTGMEVDTMQIGMTSGAIVPITFGFIGKGMDTDNAIIAGATYAAAMTSAPMDALTGALEEGGAPNGVVTEVNFSLNNNMSARPVIGSNYGLQPNIGRSNVTGNLTAYFEDEVMLAKFLDETASSLLVTAQAGAGGASYEFFFPNIKYTGGDVPTPGEGSISISMPFQALLDPVTGTNLQITRTP